jgi:Holliday junction resolvase RusA-like endonuclease
MINFTIIIDPSPTHQSALRVLKNKQGKMFVGKMANSKATKWKQEFMYKANAHKPAKPYDCPLEVTIDFHYAYLKRFTNAQKKGTFPKTTRPDLDNLEKMVLDSLTECGFMVDDSLVVKKHSSKMFADSSKIAIDIKPFLW